MSEPKCNGSTDNRVHKMLKGERNLGCHGFAEMTPISSLDLILDFKCLKCSVKITVMINYTSVLLREKKPIVVDCKVSV